ncbi:Na+/H+ antiporter family protein [Sinobacterium norvegicum]|nr:Na+/H+ antiporter NhaC family protein [Sinobacterium norvegicum]
MNAVVLAVVLMLALSLARFPVVAAIIVAALAGGLASGMELSTALASFNSGIGNGASVALSYAVLGAFAAAIATSGLPQFLSQKALAVVGVDDSKQLGGKVLICFVLLLAAIASQNLIPIHIAFIPLLVPPLLITMAKIGLDRRAVACVLAGGMITTYMFLPVGFGAIYLNDILLGNLQQAGLDTEGLSVMSAMWMPAMGMVAGLLIAIFFSYRKKRNYDMTAIEQLEAGHTEVKPVVLLLALIAIVTTFVVQLMFDSMVLGALAGFILFTGTGVVKWRESDGLFIDGMKMMATIGFIMIAAAGFAQVLKDTGDVPALVEQSAALVGNSKVVGALVMLLVGLVITMGIGSSFSTVPIIATIYVPIAVALGFSPLAIVALVGTAGALGDAGSPASDSTLGPTAGLNVDGQHDHIRDTVIPTFIHYNIPLLVFGWLAAITIG